MKWHQLISNFINNLLRVNPLFAYFAQALRSTGALNSLLTIILASYDWILIELVCHD